MNKISRRCALQSFVLGAYAFKTAASFSISPTIEHIVRYKHRGAIQYGMLNGDKIFPLEGCIFEDPYPAGGYPNLDQAINLNEVKLLVPCEPSKILAVGRNYASHIGDNPTPSKPELFFKPPTSLLNPGELIIIPPGTDDCHFEGELVIVIGKTTKNVTPAEAKTCILGVTCGNDISARDWQENDMQWWRAKGSDTFGPLGPAIATHVDYNNLLLTTRVNGEVKQRQNTGDLIFDPPTIVSFVSYHVTLLPGDVIYTGTPGQTSAIKSGDVIEIEIEGIGILKNEVA